MCFSNATPPGGWLLNEPTVRQGPVAVWLVKDGINTHQVCLPRRTQPRVQGARHVHHRDRPAQGVPHCGRPSTSLTVQLDDDVIHRAKVAAAKRGTSVSGLVTQELERLVEADDRYEDAQRRAERALGRTETRGGRHWARDDLHQR